MVRVDSYKIFREDGFVETGVPFFYESDFPYRIFTIRVCCRKAIIV